MPVSDKHIKRRGRPDRARKSRIGVLHRRESRASSLPATLFDTAAGHFLGPRATPQIENTIARHDNQPRSFKSQWTQPQRRKRRVGKALTHRAYQMQLAQLGRLAQGRSRFLIRRGPLVQSLYRPSRFDSRISGSEPSGVGPRTARPRRQRGEPDSEQASGARRSPVAGRRSPSRDAAATATAGTVNVAEALRGRRSR